MADRWTTDEALHQPQDGAGEGRDWYRHDVMRFSQYRIFVVRRVRLESGSHRGYRTVFDVLPPLAAALVFWAQLLALAAPSQGAGRTGTSIQVIVSSNSISGKWLREDLARVHLAADIVTGRARPRPLSFTAAERAERRLGARSSRTFPATQREAIDARGDFGSVMRERTTGGQGRSPADALADLAPRLPGGGYNMPEPTRHMRHSRVSPDDLDSMRLAAGALFGSCAGGDDRL